MARIRSVHPGLFTDEGWVSCSPLSRLLFIGLWTDADDQGVFEWKPLQIKMRLLPGDDANVGAMLEEMADADLLKAFEIGGKKYGAIRNFRKFQRPKKPNCIYVLPPEFRTYVAIDAESSEPEGDDPPPVRNQFPTGGENPPQMEDGGWRMENPPVAPDGADELKLIPDEPAVVDEIRQAFDFWNETASRCALPLAEDLTDGRRKSMAKRMDGGGLARWRRALDAVEMSAFCLGQVPGREGARPFRATLDFVCQAKSFQKLIEGAYGQDAKPVRPREAVAVFDPLDQWRRRVQAYLTGSRYWNTNDWEAQPGKPGCIVPAVVLAEFGYAPPEAGAAILPFPGEGRAA